MTPATRGARWLPWVALSAFTALWFARWPLFPQSLDPVYHLFIARQVAEAGGPLLYEWWEHAPAGRIHLYPPLLHLLLAELMGLGCSPTVAIRLMSVVIGPSLLLAGFLAMRRLFGRDMATSGLLLAMIPFSWWLLTARALASGLACLALIWWMVSLAQRRWVSAAALLALICYTHMGFPWVALASLGAWILLGAIKPERGLLGSLVAGLLLGGPWLARVLGHLRELTVAARGEDFILDVAPALYALAAVGAWRCWMERGRARLLVGLWLGFCAFAYPHTLRWLSGEGLLPVICLAGYGVARMARSRTRVLALSGLVLLCPSILVSRAAPSDALFGRKRPAGLEVVWLDAAPFHLLNLSTRPKPFDLPLPADSLARVANQVAQATQPGEILWSNAPYAGGFVAALAGRAVSNAMLYEVPASQSADPIGSAHLIVWFPVGPIPGIPELEQVVRRYALRPVAQDEFCLLLRNPQGTALSRLPEAGIRRGWAFMLLCGLIGLVVWDVRRRPVNRHKERHG